MTNIDEIKEKKPENKYFNPFIDNNWFAICDTEHHSSHNVKLFEKRQKNIEKKIKKRSGDNQTGNSLYGITL